MTTEQTTTVTDPRQLKAYNDACVRIADTIQTMEKDRLRAVWRLGKLVREFVQGADRGKYGANTIQTLADDLRERRRDHGVKDLVRYLYFARDIANTFDEPALERMVEHGYTYSHAKLLLPLEKELREKVQEELVDSDGNVRSTSEAEAIIHRLKGGAAKAALAEAVSDDEPEPEQAAEGSRVVEHVDFCAAEDDPEEAGDGGPKKDEKKDEKKGKDKKDEAKPAAKPEPPKKGKKEEKPEIKGSPVKLAEKFDNQLIKLISSSADFIILVDQVGKRGFDSDTAHAKYRDALMAAKGNLKILQETLPDLIQRIDDNLG